MAPLSTSSASSLRAVRLAIARGDLAFLLRSGPRAVRSFGPPRRRLSPPRPPSAEAALGLRPRRAGRPRRRRPCAGPPLWVALPSCFFDALALSVLVVSLSLLVFFLAQLY